MSSRNTPDFLAHTAAPLALPIPRWLWPLNIALMLLLVALSSRAAITPLGANASTRPYALLTCKVLACTVPAWVDAAQIRVLDHRIHADPTRADVLELSAALENDSPFEQAWPVLQLRLSDVSGNLVASGRFPPLAYLPANAPALMPRAQAVDLRLWVADPSRKAVSFDLALLDGAPVHAAATPAR